MKARAKSRPRRTGGSGNRRAVSTAAVLALSLVAAGVAVLGGRIVSRRDSAPTVPVWGASEVRERAAVLISYNESITLTPEQQKAMTASLSPIAALRQ